MSVRTYENFDLLIEQIPGGRFRARVTRSPAGETSGVDVDAPFDTLTRQNLMLKIDPGRSGMRGPVAEATDPTRLLGGGLWDSVFTGDVLQAWEGSRIHAREAGRGLRMRLVLDEAPDLAALPWELLYDDDDDQFVAQSERTPIVRYLQMGSALKPLAVNGPLDMLVVVSSPKDLPALEVDVEYENVKESLALAEGSGAIRIQRLPKPTVAELGMWLRDHEVNVLHFIGHGDYLPARKEGVVYFADDDGKSVAVGADVLGPYVQDHDPLRLVVLNACRTASAGDSDSSGGLAQGLVRRDIGAVVAMQFPISDGAASVFSREFYGATADGFPVDQAVTNARKALLAEYGAEWATPVLFLRSADGVVFDPASLAAPAVPVDSTLAPTTAVPPAPVPATPDVTEPEPPAQPEPAPERVLTLGGTEEPASASTGRATTLVDRGGAAPAGTEPEADSHEAAPTPTGTDETEDERPPRKGHRVLLTALAAGVALAIVAAFLVVQALKPDPGPTLTGPAMEAARFSTPPTIDGDGSEWAGRTAYTTPVVIVPRGGKATAASSWRLGWDAQSYYVLAEVRDPVITQTNAGKLSQLFNGDGISFELGTEVRPEDGATSLPPGDVHVLYGPTPSGQVLRAMNVARAGTFEAGEDLTEGSAAVRLVPGGYVLELSLPWSAVHVDKVERGTVLATNLVLSDALASGDKKGRLKTMETNNPGRLTNAAEFRTAWGTVTLVG